MKELAQKLKSNGKMTESGVGDEFTKLCDQKPEEIEGSVAKKSVSTIAKLEKALVDAGLDRAFINDVKKVVLNKYGAKGQS